MESGLNLGHLKNQKVTENFPKFVFHGVAATWQIGMWFSFYWFNVIVLHGPRWAPISNACYSEKEKEFQIFFIEKKKLALGFSGHKPIFHFEKKKKLILHQTGISKA